MTYVFITFFVLLFLNIYCAQASHQLFYDSKKVSMIEKCQVVADEISQLDIINEETVSDVLTQLGSISSTRLVVVDQSALTIYDSAGEGENRYALFPEIIQALDRSVHPYGNELLRDYIRVSVGSADAMKIFLDVFYEVDEV